MNIVLDLDETLVSVSTNPKNQYDFKFPLVDPVTKQTLWYYGQKRPNLEIFLRYVFKRFSTVSVWTAATADYARNVIKNIMKPDQYSKLAFVKTRGDLKLFPDGGYTKPLNSVFDKHDSIKRHNTIMIDDRRSVMVENLGNAIIVPAWKGSPAPTSDQSLAQLIIVLNGILVNQNKIGLHTHADVLYLKEIVN
jgi:TFIIF-interacting CTD phosphatase-like protein